MSVRPWYKRYPADFIAGTLEMSLEEKGAYSMVLDLIYDRGRPIPDDPQWIARVCGCSTRKWNTIRARLIEMGKINSEDGFITNGRASFELLSGEKERENHAKAARKSHESRLKKSRTSPENNGELFENNELDEKGQEHARASRVQSLESRVHIDKESPPAGPPQKKTKSNGRKKPRTGMTEDWDCTSDTDLWVMENGFDNDRYDVEIQLFRTHWIGKGELRADWDQTLRNWLLKSRDFAR